MPNDLKQLLLQRAHAKPSGPTHLPPRDPVASVGAPDPLGQEQALREAEYVALIGQALDMPYNAQTSPLLRHLVGQRTVSAITKDHVQYNDPMRFVTDPTKDRLRPSLPYDQDADTVTKP